MFVATTTTMSPRKEAVRRLYDGFSAERELWLQKAAFFHSEDLLYLKFVIPEGSRILELGCGTGHLLAALKPSYGVGVDFSEGMIAQARSAHPNLTFLQGDIEDAGFVGSLPGPFDVILIVDTVERLTTAKSFSKACTPCARATPASLSLISRISGIRP